VHPVECIDPSMAENSIMLSEYGVIEAETLIGVPFCCKETPSLALELVCRDSLLRVDLGRRVQGVTSGFRDYISTHSESRNPGPCAVNTLRTCAHDKI
jgi:hypothetical protein